VGVAEKMNFLSKPLFALFGGKESGPESDLKRPHH
jgi:hypothetical protein